MGLSLGWGRRTLPPQRSQRQCDALTAPNSALAMVAQYIPGIEGRVTRITCDGVDTATQVGVGSADIYSDRERFAVAVRDADYRFIQIPGSSHSGNVRITTSVITIANLFDTLSRGDRLSEWRGLAS